MLRQVLFSIFFRGVGTCVAAHNTSNPLSAGLSGAAGDHVKFNFPMAYTSVVLSWGLLEFKDAYEASGQLQWLYDCIKWPLDYLLKCHVADDVLYVQVMTSSVCDVMKCIKWSTCVLGS